VLTERGQELLRRAAPTHVRALRDNLIDLISDQERLVLAEVFERVVSHLREQ
jgi:DNA-binding MarR family transcriptional regulator